MGAGSHAISAANALSVIGGTKHIHIHLAYPAACAAGGALVRIHRQPVDRDPVAQAVKGPQRAQPFTERTVEEHRQHHNSQQDAALPCEEPAQTGTDAGIGQGQGDAALQNTGGAEIFAEERIPHPHLVHHRHGQDDDKEDQDPIFQISEDVEPLCAEFFCGDFVEQFLKPAEGAQEAAYHSAQQGSNEQQKAHHIIGKVEFG